MELVADLIGFRLKPSAKLPLLDRYRCVTLPNRANHFKLQVVAGFVTGFS